jgi:DNA-binding MarR family transcriptional regulator
VSELSDLLLCDKSNITRLIKGMEQDGLVYRCPHETDGRTLRLYLTSAGEVLGQQVAAAHERFNVERFDGLQQFSQHELLETLLELKSRLRQKLPANGTRGGAPRL